MARGGAKHSNGRLFRILTGLPGRIDKQYSIGLRKNKKLQRPYIRAAAADFPQQKSHRSVLADPCVFPHLSSSPDLRLNSSAWPSQISPMTGFRQMQNLHAYSGGTVRDSHPVSYSLVVLLPHPQALKRNIHFPKIIYDESPFVNSQNSRLHHRGGCFNYLTILISLVRFAVMPYKVRIFFSAISALAISTVFVP